MRGMMIGPFTEMVAIASQDNNKIKDIFQFGRGKREMRYLND